MKPATILLLAVSVGCSTARAIFSKKLSAQGNDQHFYITQALLFAVAAAVIGIVNIKDMVYPSATTALLALAYGILTISSQWTYTIALSKAPVSVCAMVYSFGFIIPTVFGTVLWHEAVTILKIISILLCIGTILLTSIKPENKTKVSELPASLIIAMLSSGGLGLVQKLQQRSDAHNETGVFLFLAFVLAMLFSLAASVFTRKKAGQKCRIAKAALPILLVGISMALANTANTLLAGLLPSAVVFPIVNVGVILASLTISVVALKERLSKNQIAAFCLGIAAILLFNL